MVRCEKGLVSFEGNVREIMADMGTLIHSVYNKLETDKEREFFKKRFYEQLEFAFLTNEELDKKVKELKLDEDEETEVEDSQERRLEQMVRGQPTIPVHKNEVRSYLTSGTKINSKCIKGFPGGSAGKESTCNTGDLGSVPGLGRSPGEGKGYPLQYSGLENSTDYMVHGVTKGRT